MDNLEKLLNKLKKELEQTKKENKKLNKLLFDFGYPENKPTPKSDPQYWKEKYKRLMDEKIYLERKYTELFECSEKMATVLRDSGIDLGNFKNYSDLRNQAGVLLFPELSEKSKVTNLNYKNFRHDF